MKPLSRRESVFALALWIALISIAAAIKLETIDTKYAISAIVTITIVKIFALAASRMLSRYNARMTPGIENQISSHQLSVKMIRQDLNVFGAFIISIENRSPKSIRIDGAEVHVEIDRRVRKFKCSEFSYSLPTRIMPFGVTRALSFSEEIERPDLSYIDCAKITSATLVVTEGITFDEEWMMRMKPAKSKARRTFINNK